MRALPVKMWDKTVKVTHHAACRNTGLMWTCFSLQGERGSPGETGERVSRVVLTYTMIYSLCSEILCCYLNIAVSSGGSREARPPRNVRAESEWQDRHSPMTSLCSYRLTFLHECYKCTESLMNEPFHLSSGFTRAQWTTRRKGETDSIKPNRMRGSGSIGTRFHHTVFHNLR